MLTNLNTIDYYSIKPHNPTIEASPSLQPVTLPYSSLSESSIYSSYHLVNPISSPPSPLACTQPNYCCPTTNNTKFSPKILPTRFCRSPATSQVWMKATPQSCHMKREVASCNPNSDPLAQPPLCTTKHMEAQRWQALGEMARREDEWPLRQRLKHRQREWMLKVYNHIKIDDIYLTRVLFILRL
jgi:hypothetical protein